MSEYGILMLQLPIESITREMYFDQVVRKDSYLGKHPSRQPNWHHCCTFWMPIVM